MKLIPSKTELELLSLVVRELNGREVAREYEKRFGRPISYGTLYTLFGRLKSDGWVNVREASDDDGRLRYFRITGAGVKAVDRAGCAAAAAANLARGVTS